MHGWEVECWSGTKNGVWQKWKSWLFGDWPNGVVSDHVVRQCLWIAWTFWDRMEGILVFLHPLLIST